MTSVYEITNPAGVLGFAAWTLVVCAMAKFLFGSYPAAEILYRLASRDRLRRQRVAAWSADAPRHPSDGAAGLHNELSNIGVAPAWQRALSYFLTCFACQAFWSAVVVFAVTRGVADWRAWIFSASAYSAASTMLARASQGRTAAPHRRGCGACGGK